MRFAIDIVSLDSCNKKQEQSRRTPLEIEISEKRRIGGKGAADSTHRSAKTDSTQRVQKFASANIENASADKHVSPSIHTHNIGLYRRPTDSTGCEHSVMKKSPWYRLAADTEIYCWDLLNKNQRYRQTADTIASCSSCSYQCNSVSPACRHQITVLGKW